MLSVVVVFHPSVLILSVTCEFSDIFIYFPMPTLDRVIQSYPVGTILIPSLFNSLFTRPKGKTDGPK